MSGICWDWLARASRLVHGIDHGIVVLNISAAIQYHAMRVEPRMVFVVEHAPHRFGRV